MQDGFEVREAALVTLIVFELNVLVEAMHVASSDSACVGTSDVDEIASQ